MSSTALALIGYISWTLLLLLLMGFYRTSLVLAGTRAANSFAADGSGVSPLLHRITRAHANCYECFPIIGGVLIFAMLTGTAALTDPLALLMLGARVFQSGVHVASTTAMAVQVRFAFFGVQLGIAIYWIAKILFGGM